MTFIIQPFLLTGRTMRKGDMPIRDVVEEMDFFFFQGQRRGDGVHGGVAPTLVEEPAVLVELREVVDVGFGAQPVEVADLEVGPLSARVW